VSSFGDVLVNVDSISSKDQGIRGMPDASEGAIEINGDVYSLPSTFNFDSLLRVPPNVRDGLICWKFLKIHREQAA
jgi:hypothetical protein